MRLIDYLVDRVGIGTIVIFRDGGSQIGMTRVDNDGLYLHSLNNVLLHLYRVINWSYEERDLATKNVLVLDVKPICK